MRGLPAIAALMLAGCSAGQDTEPASPPASFHIDKASLYRAEPDDICRFKDTAFLQRLTLRVTAALPPGTRGFDFVDFDAHTAPEGQGMEAVLRFRSSSADGQARMMYAAGPFDPATCAIGQMTGGTGAGPHAPDAVETFRVAESEESSA
ncbi:hypothetical protein [Novosphingobium beihaiensis]|uniref:Lipoprotein n=1 Tax=Novosphingobium beihaiensis TaxID=2930389 RepID=A0ABT0BSR8_9SPHN|nr:hypothetical protein [Novosphingobium beihaiensis]MCJ2188092.1 hypothetical protein [Novosphingobium beihaiensis]